ncbi:MAG: CDP-alcohol phosphatidyltransferase family protein [Prevotella sp.]|nr:CDP-alcohol phosphatidyltransferase family protein [Prevotella sp.]MBR6187855.1 CDP-alcohol phosphatidyltransferase family protein [Prevotella sp.]MBR6190426.1 CDP-alcohol phosphatidyltransferase family protein [Prevotella sp.]
MNEKIFKTLKSAETEDWLDYHVIRPLCYYLSVFFAKLGVHPNTVTILSMIVGAASCVFFASGCFYYEGTMGLIMNLIAIAMLMVADLLDCTDGQLARLTGKKSRLGRILDGLAGFTWFIPIYHALVWRFYQHHELEFSLLGINETEQNVIIATIVVYILGVVSGFAGLALQQRLADYYIQVHLFFLKGEKGSELDNSKRQQEIYDQMGPEVPAYERSFQKSYIDYTRKQEKATPQFQRLLARLKEKFGSTSNIPADVREDIHRHSLAIMPWNGMLTFNFRSAFLFLFCLLDVPAMNFVWEIVGMGLLCLYVNKRHEAFCKRIADNL